MTVETQPGRKGRGETRRQSIISDRRQRISESFSGQNDNPEELKKSFDEWMKIVADNKINASNSWTLALIDYFHDLTLLREGDSINFQKASCTLDGCVKIYTSRVDSVDVETKKLLSGLQNYGDKNDDMELGDENEDSGVAKQKKREHRHTNTLEKEITNLDLKKFDIEFTVDPLFRKTSADFDEGGARGLLLNHLCISSNGQIIFDAGDISMNAIKEKEAVVEPSWIDYNKLKGVHVQIINYIEQFESKIGSIWDTEICWALRNFEFSSQDNQICADIDFTKEAEQNDLYDFSPNVDDHVSIGGEDYDDFGLGAEPDGFLPDNYEISADSQPQYLPANGLQEGVFSYFDMSSVRNWAGPEHWRSKPLSLVRSDKPKLKKRLPKEVELINFLDERPVDLKTLFAQGSSSINLSKTDKIKSKNLLPEDLHISYKDIAKLFTNPEYKITFRSKNNPRLRTFSSKQDINFVNDGTQDDLFWAENEMINPDNSGINNYDAETPGGFEFDPYDEDDESPLINEGETPAGLPGDLSVFLDYGDQLVDQPKKVLAAPLKYAKTAKRVDVKRLKENIWKEMLEIKDESTELPIEGIVEKPKKFTDLVHGLDQFYPEHKRQDISVAFCFICVLHLANEQNLSIKGSEQLQELIITQNI